MLLGGKVDFSAKGRARVYLFTALGTLFCIMAAFAIDSYSLETGTWAWGEQPINNLLIPLVLAPPFFYYLLSKLRELSIAHHELMTIASTDPLTSCLNRRAFTAMVEAYLDRVNQETLTAGSLLVLDVDHFKKVNDVFGHEKGDEALKAIADTIKANVRDSDLVGRLGGEEFSVFLPGLDQSLSEVAADRLRAAVNAVNFNPGARPHKLSISIGGVSFKGKRKFEDLYRHADERLYAAKRAGRNRIDVMPMLEPIAA